MPPLPSSCRSSPTSPFASDRKGPDHVQPAQLALIKPLARVIIDNDYSDDLIQTTFHLLSPLPAIRVYMQFDSRLTFADFFAKLQLWARAEAAG